MARPRKATADRHGETVCFTIRQVDLVTVRQRAAAAGLTLSAYIRTLLLNRKLAASPRRALDHETYDQLRRIGVNLNQAVHRLHVTGRPSAALTAAAGAVERFITEHLDHGPQGGGQGSQL